jgi:hypothetical protein
VALPDALHPSSHQWCVQCSGGPNHTTLYIGPLCLRFRCLLIQGQAQMKWSLPLQACCSLNEDTTEFCISCHSSASQHHDQVFPLLPLMWQKMKTQILYNSLSIILDHYILIYTYHQELMTSVGSHVSSSLLFVIKVMVWHFVSSSHMVMIEVIVMLPSNCCCGDFSAIS